MSNSPPIWFGPSCVCSSLRQLKREVKEAMAKKAEKAGGASSLTAPRDVKLTPKVAERDLAMPDDQEDSDHEAEYNEVSSGAGGSQEALRACILHGQFANRLRHTDAPLAELAPSLCTVVTCRPRRTCWWRPWAGWRWRRPPARPCRCVDCPRRR